MPSGPKPRPGWRECVLLCRAEHSGALMTKEEKNRKIAEWLGWRPVDTGDLTIDNKPLLWQVPDSAMRPVPDFYLDEAANALVLEAMPAPELYKHAKDGVAPFAAWRCRYDWGLDVNVVHPDRRTAICEAALKLIKEG